MSNNLICTWRPLNRRKNLLTGSLVSETGESVQMDACNVTLLKGIRQDTHQNRYILVRVPPGSELHDWLTHLVGACKETIQNLREPIHGIHVLSHLASTGEPISSRFKDPLATQSVVFKVENLDGMEMVHISDCHDNLIPTDELWDTFQASIRVEASAFWISFQDHKFGITLRVRHIRVISDPVVKKRWWWHSLLPRDLHIQVDPVTEDLDYDWAQHVASLPAPVDFRQRQVHTFCKKVAQALRIQS